MIEYQHQLLYSKYCTLKYVLVKQAGKTLGNGDELNGITFAGVGSATTVDYIQVHENLDDGDMR